MTPRTRLASLVAAAAGLWLVRDFIVAPDPAPVPRTLVRPRSTVVAEPSADICTTPTELPTRGRFVAQFNADPFTARVREVVTRKVAVAPPPPPVLQGPPAPVPPPPPPPPPRLPFRFMGMVNDPEMPASVFLISGNTLILAHPGDTLEGGFRLESVSPRELVFQHPQHKQAVRLSVDGETP
jgi:hypothetical protein